MNTMIQRRIAAVRQRLIELELDALMVSTQENRYYLSGFDAEDTQFDETAGNLIITDRRLVLATDSRYDLQARTQAVDFEVVRCPSGLDKALPDIVTGLGIRRLGFESVRLSVKAHRRYMEALGNGPAAVELVPTDDLVESLRRIKSEAEIRRTVAALRLAEQAFTAVRPSIQPGMTEKQLAWAMERAMREAGAQGLAFPVIVASGPRSALPHAVPTDRRLARGEPILLDWGVRLDHYCSDTSRTVIIGQADDRFKRVFDTVVAARDMAIAAIRNGASGTQVDKLARDHIHDSGFPDRFGHSLGHGTGLAVHEGPRLSPTRDDRLEAGMIVTVEPGIYIPEWGGVRMENQVVVRSEGAQVLNDAAPFDPLIDA